MNRIKLLPDKRHIVIKILALIIAIIGIVLYIVFNSLNHLITEAIVKGYDSNAISDVYELKFEKLRIDFLQRKISLNNVLFRPLKNPSRPYPYINSTISLKAKKISLDNIDFIGFYKKRLLNLNKINIEQPEIELNLADDLPVFFPFRDSSAIADKSYKKNFIEALNLNEFKVTNASILTKNPVHRREIVFKNVTITLKDLLINQVNGKDILFNKKVELFIGNIEGHSEKEEIKRLKIKNFKLSIDAFKLHKTIDSLQYTYTDFNLDMHNLDILTIDSTYSISLSPLNLSHKNKTLQIGNLSIKPNVDHATIQNKYKYQHTEFSLTIRKIHFYKIELDSIIHRQKLFVDEIAVDKVFATLYKDNTKPVDKDHLPKYLGQQINSVPFPVWIKKVKVTNCTLENTEINKDRSIIKASINRGTLLVTNITNLHPDSILFMQLETHIQNKVHTKVQLNFNYKKEQFSMEGRVSKFNLPDLSPLLASVSPIKVKKGIADEIFFSGMVYPTFSSGTMKFLYHDLELEFDNKDQAKWKNSVMGLVADIGLNASNPISQDLPPKVVRFQFKRDMHKAFTNVIIKSALTGIKETLLLSSQNRKTYKDAKQKDRKKDKQKKSNK